MSNVIEQARDEIARIEIGGDILGADDRARLAELKAIVFRQPGGGDLIAELGQHRETLAQLSQCVRHFARKSLQASRDFKARRCGPQYYRCQRITARTYIESYAAIRANAKRAEAEIERMAAKAETVREAAE